MDLDLAEYDQVEEIKLILENNGRMYCDGSSSKFLVTLSSGSDQTSLDDINCENDYVFLPDLAGYAPAASHTRPQVAPESRNIPNDTKSEEAFSTSQPQQAVNPFSNISNNGNNPFHTKVKRIESFGKSVEQISHREFGVLKPIGVMENYPTVNDSKKLSDLMTQIVARSDSINIEIQCSYCNNPITCPPSDISSWLNHMNNQHNCRVCPICNKLIGLGPLRDASIMRHHVVEHFDNEWLEQSANKSTFTFGLQKKWFSGNACDIKDSR